MSDPPPNDALMDQVLAYRRAGNTEAGLREAAALVPREAAVQRQWGRALFEMRRYDEAYEAYTTALRLTPDYAEGWQSLGILWLQRGRPDVAATAFTIALVHMARGALRAAGHPVHPAAATVSGLADDEPLLSEIRPPPDVAAALAASGRFAHILHHLGLACMAAERFDDAAHAYEAALAYGLDGNMAEIARSFLEAKAERRLVRRRS